MTPEAHLWERLRPVMRALGLDPQRVENAVGDGTPDVNYCEGWVELKAVERWPRRPDTPVTFPHFTSFQSSWLATRWRAGGAAWLAAAVGDEVFLFVGLDAAAVRRGLTQDGFRRLALWSGCLGREEWPTLKALLTLDQEEVEPPDLRARLLRYMCNLTVEQLAGDLKVGPDLVREAEQKTCSLTYDLIDALVC